MNCSRFCPTVVFYRVAPKLRSVNEKAYTPQIVSVGPLHRGKLELQAMEDQKNEIAIVTQKELN